MSVIYMMYDERGNALGSWDDKEEAIISMDQIVQGDSAAKDELVVFGYDEDGSITEVFKYEDTFEA